MSNLIELLNENKEIKVTIGVKKEKDQARIALTSNIKNISGEEALKLLILGIRNACVMELGEEANAKEILTLIKEVIKGLPDNIFDYVEQTEEHSEPITNMSSWKEAKEKLKYFSDK